MSTEYTQAVIDGQLDAESEDGFSAVRGPEQIAEEYESVLLELLASTPTNAETAPTP